MPNLPRLPVKLRFIIPILATVFILSILSRQVFAWTYNPALPACTISFSPDAPQPPGTSTTVTVTASGANNPSVSSLYVSTDPTNPLTLNPGTSTRTASWTSTNTNPPPTFTANVQNELGNTGSCPSSYPACATQVACPTTCQTTTASVPNGSCDTTTCSSYCATSCSGNTCCNVNYGNACISTSSPNSCGDTASSAPGTYQCDGTCSAPTPSAPAVPVNYGNACNRNACGGTGVIRCDGTCSTTAPNCPACTYGSTDLDGSTACSSSWSPTDDYKCSLAQTRTCYRNTLNGSTSCTLASYTDTRTTDTCTTHGYTCNAGNECIPPAPTAAPMTCSTTPAYTINISWSANNVTYVDLSDKTNDTDRNNNYSHKNVTGTSSTQAATGFGNFKGTGVTSLSTGTTYYARVWDDVTKTNSAWVPSASFSVPICCDTCVANTCTSTAQCGNVGTCTATSYSGGGSCTQVSINCYLNKICTNPRQRCDNGLCVYTPWIQTTGDVHSNTKINAPGGP